jgi:predicted MFS family arabinose efflux permease
MALPAVLRERDFRRFWLASLASNAGSWLQVVGAGWLIYDLTKSPAAVGALALVARAPAFVLSAYAGQLADRFDRRVVGVVTFAAQAVGAGGLAVLALLDHANPAIIYAATFVVGVGFALGLPAMLALVGVLAGRDKLPDAIALNAAGINVARLAGPTLGGLLLAGGGPAACFAVNAASFVVLIVVLVGLPSFPPASPGSRARMSEALRHAVHDPAARRLLAGMAIFAALAAPAQELAPVVAARLGAREVGLGILLGVMGGGALCGAWLLGRVGRRGYPRHHALPTATVVFAAAMGLLAATRWFWLALVAMLVGGAFWIWMFIATNAAIQLRSPPELLGRMLGLYQLAVLGPIAVGALAAGALAEVVGIRWSLATCAVLLGAWGLWSLTHRVPAIDGMPAGKGGGVREGLFARRDRSSWADPADGPGGGALG